MYDALVYLIFHCLTQRLITFDLMSKQRYVWFSDYNSCKAEEDINLLEDFVVVCNLFPYFESYQHPTLISKIVLHT